MTDDDLWTLDELAARVAQALARGYDGQPSSRVREVPDKRAIRWYTTTGLVDRPAAMRGRTALYGERHLLQLVAIKRLQAQGLSLAQVQSQLAGAGDRALRRAAGIDPTGTPFWTLAPASAKASLVPTATPTAEPSTSDTLPLLSGVPLAPDVTLLLAAAPTPDDVTQIRAAAAPLLALLARRGLTQAPAEGNRP